LIGPKGGFSEPEVLGAEQVSFTELGFGLRIVRNETAAMQVLWGDMG